MKQLIGSAIFNVVMWVSVLIYGPLSLLTFPFPFRWRYHFITRWGVFQVWLVRLLCGVRYEVYGRDRLPPGPAIILAKHQSAWETLAFMAIFPPQIWVLKRELMLIPLFGWALALLRPIAINRGSPREAVQQVLTQGSERLQAGIWVTIFPEGTRVAPGRNRRWAPSGAALAVKTGYPVVPVAHNAGHYWPRRGFIKRAGTIQVIIGPAIDPHGMSREDVMEKAETWVVETMRQLEDDAKRC